MERRIRVRAPAKINLRLKILARETSGYHSLETLFCAVSLADELEVQRGGDGVQLAVSGKVETGPSAENLAARAARRFYAGLGERAALRVRLHKRIPAGAGLGGGSSDAAAVLRALNAMHGGPVSSAALLQWGAELGSDVPFFLCASPLALAWGRGERLLALPPLPARPVLIAHPGTAISTARAFRRIEELRQTQAPSAAGSFPLAALGSWSAIAVLAENDFEPVAFDWIPLLPRARDALREAGAEIALLTGSGSSLFGVFPEGAELEPAEHTLRALGLRTWRADTLAAVPDVG